MNSSKKILPLISELPVDYADRIGLCYSAIATQTHKKTKGQFFTPAVIASFMGNMAKSDHKQISILDPGCGTAILSCAIVENLVKINLNLQHIVLDVYETDAEILIFTIQVLDYLKEWLNLKNITFEFNIHNEDFILKNADALKKEDSLFPQFQLKEYDFIISNPPYFKLNKEDVRAKSTEKISNGQPNIYSLFMAIAAKMLSIKGQLIFITPRSYTSGNYFKSFRAFFFENVTINQLHLFDSRKDTFNRDNVLQETLILKACRKEKLADNKSFVTITSSKGIIDLSNPRIKKYPLSQIINFTSKEKIIHIPINEEEEQIIELFRAWKGSLNKYNIQISTGPVVAFRAKDYIRDVFENGNVILAPLIWLHNVTKMHLEWPLTKPNKGQFIQIVTASQSLLIPNKNYILLRRFSAKDDKSRLVASPYYSKTVETEFIGIENKVNYIYRPKGELEQSEITGLAVILNSKLFDSYFRIFNGNVNVSATELREMPLPPLELIKQIGEQNIKDNIEFTQKQIDDIVNQTLMNKETLIYDSKSN